MNANAEQIRTGMAVITPVEKEMNKALSEDDIDNIFINPGLPYTENEFQALAKHSDDFLICDCMSDITQQDQIWIQ